MRGWSLRARLLAAFVALVMVIGGGALIALERALGNDLVASLDHRLRSQAAATAGWLRTAGHPQRMAQRLSQVVDARIVFVGADGRVQGDSHDDLAVGKPIGDAPEVHTARGGVVGRATRQMSAGGPLNYVVATPVDDGRVVVLAVPLADVDAIRGSLRGRFLWVFAAAFAAALLLGLVLVRALIHPLAAMTRDAEKLAGGDYAIAPPSQSPDELGLLSRTLAHLASEVQRRVGELTAQRDLLSAVIERMVEGVVVVDGDGVVVVANQSALRMCGGTSPLPQPLAAKLDGARGGAEGRDDIAIGSRFVQVSSRPLADGAGAIAVLHDLTQLRALEKVRREFLANAAHELRTPVTAIAGYSETLLGDDVDATTRKEFLTVIRRNASRIERLVSDLLVLERLEARPERAAAGAAVRLAEVVAEAASTTRAAVPVASIELAIDEGLAVAADRDGLEHVVQNLLDNAVRHGGARARVSARRAGDKVRLEVRDWGPGVPAELRERVFDRFYRVDVARSRGQGGSGLGLAIVKSQVEAMGGRVWLEPAEGGGTSALVELMAA